MRLSVLSALIVSTLTLAACESLSLDRPGQSTTPVVVDDSVSEDPALDSPVTDPGIAEEEPEGPANPELADNPGDGVIGAAVCISAAYYLADAELLSEDDALGYAEIWTSILDVIPAEVEERQDAVNDAYAAFFALDQQGDQDGTQGALAQYEEGGQCADPAVQRQFLARFGDPDLMDSRLQGAE